jgi:hypothetical protein
MADLYANHATGLNSPYAEAAAVTKSDDTVLTTTRALYVGGTGNLSVVMAGSGDTVVIESVPAGMLLPIRVTKVLAATTATKIVALW